VRIGGLGFFLDELQFCGRDFMKNGNKPLGVCKTKFWGAVSMTASFLTKPLRLYEANLSQTVNGTITV